MISGRNHPTHASKVSADLQSDCGTVDREAIAWELSVARTDDPVQEFEARVVNDKSAYFRSDVRVAHLAAKSLGAVAGQVIVKEPLRFDVHEQVRVCRGLIEVVTEPGLFVDPGFIILGKHLRPGWAQRPPRCSSHGSGTGMDWQRNPARR